MSDYNNPQTRLRAAGVERTPALISPNLAILGLMNPIGIKVVPPGLRAKAPTFKPGASPATATTICSLL